MRFRIFALAASVLVGAQFAAADNLWGNYHWEKTSTSALEKALGNNLTTNEWDTALASASLDWTASSVLNAPVRSGTAKNTKRCSASGGKIEVCNDTYGNNGWLGIASISVSGGHITSGYAKLNDTYYDTPTYNTHPWRISVMCQEIGHLWGLGHNDEDFSTTNGTCMDYSNDPVPNQHPDQHDYTMLEQIYGHEHTSDGGGGSCNPRSPKCNNNNGVAARVLAELNLNGPRQWGRRISEHGPTEIFELDLGDGNRIITAVRWTMERMNAAHDDH